jgi:hypothetical protein
MKRFKLLVALLLTCLTTLLCAFALTACGGSSETVNENETIDTSGGSNNSGSGGSSGDEEQVVGGNDGEQNAVVSHRLTLVSAKSATCTADGNTAYYTCSHCDKWFEDSEATTEITNKSSVTIYDLGHNYSTEFTVDKAATCTEVGSKSKHCSRCFSTMDVTSIEKKAHSWNDGKVTIAATCTVKGTKTYTCTVCSTTKEEEIAALGHTPQPIAAIEATCTSTGLTEGSKCSVCQTVLVEQTEIPKSHKYVNEICSFCNQHKPTEGLIYTLSSSGKYYTVSGIGTATNRYIYIASEYNDLPVTAIDAGAFNCCGRLISITIPDTVTSIDYQAFRYCSGLTNVTLGNGLTAIGEYAFYGCSDLTSITIPDSVTSIGRSAFSDCSGLTSVTIGKGVTSIGGGAFYGCSALTSITIPHGVTSIGGSAFGRCSSLTSVTIPSSVTTIGGSAFESCSNLTSVTIPEGVTSIGDGAFYECYKLVEVYNFSRLKTSSGSLNGYLGAYAKNIYTSAKSKSKLKTVDDYIFYEDGDTVYLIEHIGKATVLTLPNDYNGASYSIYAYAFYQYTSLTSITIPDSVTSIGRYAFQQCHSLTSVIIPNSVTSIDRYAFYLCDSLTNVTLGNGVTAIGVYAFYGSNLKIINYRGTKEEWYNIDMDVSCNSELIEATRYYSE